MMNAEQIKSLAASGEGFNAEFKLAVPSKVRELSQEVCAFANAAGGVLLVGVNDRNEIVGTSVDNAKRSAIQQAIGEISPAIQCTLQMVDVEGKQVGILEVPSGPNKPYVLSGAIYVRVGPNTQKLTTAAEMRDFFQQSDRIYFDEMPCTGFDDFDLESITVSAFRTEGGFHPTIPDEQLLQHLQLFTISGEYKSGAVLFFARQPQDWYPQAVLRCVRFRGVDKRYIADDKSFSGTVYLQYISAMDWLRSHLHVRYDIEGQGSSPRKEIWEIPQTIFKEAVINALSHRDYYEKGAVTTIEVFDDRVEIYNPGGLLSAIQHEFGRRSLSRNPLIFGLFERMNLVEKIGSGIPRMRELMADAGLAEPLFSMDGIFTVTFSRPSEWKTVMTIPSHLSPEQQNLLKFIKAKPTVTRSELSLSTGMSEPTVARHIQKLKKAGVLKRIGGAKGGKWQVVLV